MSGVVGADRREQVVALWLCANVHRGQCGIAAGGGERCLLAERQAEALLARLDADTPTATHEPCCSSHNETMTCAKYRRTHFVHVRPCCEHDAAYIAEAALSRLADQAVNTAGSDDGVDKAVRDYETVRAARADATQTALAPILALCFASDDGTEYEHNDGCEGEAECPACWAASGRAALAVPGDEGDDCPHDSHSGVDQTDPNDPAKVWRCDGCGRLTTLPAVHGGGSTTAADGDCRWCDGVGCHRCAAGEVKKRGWDCDYIGCAKTADDGPLWRMNPKGQGGVFMCAEHRDLIEREDASR